jgi:RNA polymerase sigma factor (sigma-70 family)
MNTASLTVTDDILAARDGDIAALQRVLTQSRQNLRRYAEYHCVVNDAEDAVQECLIQVSRRIGDLRQAESFTSWMFRIVKRECNRLKRGLRLLTGDAITEDILPLGHFEPVELRHDVAAALESLPVHYREIILLRDLEGLSIQEIASRVEITPEAAKSRLHRARVLAREYLES